MSDGYDIPETYTYPTDPVTEGRKGVIEGRRYDSVAITALFYSVEEGDVLDIETWGSTTPDPKVTVVGWDVDEPIAADERGNKYRLWPRMVTNQHPTGTPWLRSEPGNESRGKIRTVTVLERGD